MCVRAFTLLEMLIVLALLSTVMLTISITIDIHLRQMTINRTEVEEAQLARVILEKIARDIRSVIVPLRQEHLEVDTSILDMMGLEGFDDLFDEFGWEGFDLQGFDLQDTEDREELLIYGTLPGIYGGPNWIQIDTARLPRGEMFGARQIQRGTSFAVDRLSASKTVLYYLGRDTGTITRDDPRFQTERLMGSLGRSLEHNAPQYGLFRRLLDRQASQFAMHEGIEWEHERDDELLAHEVESVEFLYFDPTIGVLGMTGDWVDHWDMDDRQMFPSAVKIIVGIRRPDFGRSLSTLGQTEAREPVVFYSLIVPIPITVDAVPFDEFNEEWEDDFGDWE